MSRGGLSAYLGIVFHTGKVGFYLVFIHRRISERLWIILPLACDCTQTRYDSQSRVRLHMDCSQPRLHLYGMGNSHSCTMDWIGTIGQTPTRTRGALPAGRARTIPSRWFPLPLTCMEYSHSYVVVQDAPWTGTRPRWSVVPSVYGRPSTPIMHLRGSIFTSTIFDALHINNLRCVLRRIGCRCRHVVRYLRPENNFQNKGTVPIDLSPIPVINEEDETNTLSQGNEQMTLTDRIIKAVYDDNQDKQDAAIRIIREVLNNTKIVSLSDDAVKDITIL